MKNIILQKRMRGLHSWISSSCLFSSRLTGLSTNGFKRKLVSSFTLLLFLALGNASWAQIDFKQFANSPQESWINGILNPNNSVYFESTSTLQRVCLTGITTTTGNEHVMTLGHLAIKGNHHAYDFITSYDRALLDYALTTGAPFTGLAVDGEAIGPPFNSAFILGLYNGPNKIVAQPVASGNYASILGDNVGLRVAAYDAVVGGGDPVAGALKRGIQLYGNQPITAASLVFTGYDAQNYANYELHWTSTSTNILMLFGGHLALGSDYPGFPLINYGPGKGAADISGGPYHFKLFLLDGASLGNQDNQIQSNTIIAPPPPCTIAPSIITICQGATPNPTFTGPAGMTTYAWSISPAATLLNATSQTVTVSNPGPGSYTLTLVTTLSGATSIGPCNATLVVNPNPACAITGNGTICAGSNSQFCATAGMATYAWTGPGGFTASTACITVSVAGAYNVTITDANGCHSDCSKTLIVNPNPTCAITGNDTICAGSTTQFCATPGMASYAWTGPGGFTASTACITIGTAGQYNVTITDGNGCYSNCSRTLIVNPNPTCAITGNDTICTGSTTQFCATPGMATYAWTGPGGFTASTACITIGTAGQYNVTITDANGCHSNCSRTLIVNPNPTCAITGNDTICSGSTTQFCATPGMASYAWTGPGGFTASTACITIGTAGQYNVTITDGNGCYSNCSRTLIVNPNPTCAITGNDTICTGSTTQFCATPGMATYAWTGPGGFTASTACITIGTAGQYNVTITDGNGCYSNCSRTLIVNPNPTCAITGYDTICTGYTSQFCATPGMAVYEWTGPNGFTASTQCITVGTAGQYNVKITDGNGCYSNCSKTLIVNPNPACAITGNGTICAGSTTQFCATPGMATYAWTGPGGFTASTQCITIGTAGQYNVTITDGNGCYSNCSRTLIVNPNPTCAITGNDTICTGSTTQFCATPGMATYAWTGPGGFTASTACITIGTAGQYNVTITDGNGCYSNCSRTLIVNPNPICDIIGGNEICAGGSATFTVNGGPGATVTWTGPAGFTASGPTITVGVAGTYFATVISPSGCISHCDRTLIVHSNPVPSVPDVAQCAGLTATFCTTDLGAGFAYQWYLNNSPISGAQSPCYTTGVLALTDNGKVYKVVVTDNNFSTHCFGEDSGTLTVYPTPDITLRTLFVCPGGVIHLLSRVIALDPAIFNLPLSFIPAGTTFALFTGPDIAHLTPVLDPDNVTPPAHIWIRATGPLGGCADIKLLDIDLNAPPTCAITGNDTICAGGSSQFCATAGMASYSWTGPGGFTAVTQCITVTVAGAYTVTITDSVGCSSTCSRTLIVNPLPTCSITGNQTICTGGTSQFCATAGMASYAWTGPNGFTASTQCITVTTAGTYSVTITDANTCTNSCSLPLNVQSCGEGCTPGYWQGGKAETNGASGLQQWDQVTDPIAIAVKNNLGGTTFITTTNFYSAFPGVNPNGKCAPSSSLTLLAGINLGGGNCNKLIRHGIAGILNASSLAAYPLPPNITSVSQLRDAITTAINNCACEPLATQLAANNELSHAHCGQITFNMFSKQIQESLIQSTSIVAYPNPFKDRVSFEITPAVSGNTTLDIFNILGQRVQNVFTGYLEAGMIQKVEWNTSRDFSNSTYIYILKMGDHTVTGKLLNTDR